MRLLIILGEGGHTKQMIRLVELLGSEYDYHYLLAENDPVSANKILTPGPIYRIIQVRTKRQGVTDNAFTVLRKSLHALQQSWRVLSQARPDAIIGAGPSLEIPIALVARLRRIPLIHVETASRPETITLTGRIIYRLHLASRFYVQWEHFLADYPRARYAGRLL